MDIIETIDAMTARSDDERAAGRTISFVPTMGALHEGHLSLMREGRERADSLVASIFVNPAQFSPNEDLAKYPREMEADLSKCMEVGVDAVFCPTNEMMYPESYHTYIAVEKLSGVLCGTSRPTHFSGVTTICAKLFNIVKPHVAVFGEKDYQQLVIIKRMVSDLNMPLSIVGGSIVREADGLAMSSRNRYLSDEERMAARSLSESLGLAQEMVVHGERDMNVIRDAVRTKIASTDIPRIDYVEIIHPETLEEAEGFPARLCIAALVGPARLIDNCPLGY